MILIGISGFAGVGKDTVGQILAESGFRRFAFADALRDEVAAALGAADYPMPTLLSRLAVEAFCTAPVEEVYAKPTTIRMRALLQEWGTEYRRAQAPNYWSKIVAASMAGVERACITDVRYADEAEFVRAHGGVVWRVNRPGYGPSAHASERLNFAADYAIDNSGDMDQLRREVSKALEVLS